MSRAVGRHALRDQAAPLALVTLLSTVAGLGFAAVFVGWGFAWIPILGAVTAGAVTALSIHRGLLIGESLALSILAFLVVGTVAVGGASVRGATGFLSGLVIGWAELLTSFTPLTPTRSMSALPFVVAWFGGMIGGELLRATRLPALPATGPLVAFATSLLFTVEDRVLALTQGVLMVAGTLALGLVQQRRYQTLEEDLTTGSTQRWSARGLLTTGVVLAAVLVGAPMVGPQLPLADANERFDLREYLIPPFDPLAVPSPLTGVKGQLKPGADEQVMLEVRSPDRVSRLTTAVLGAYDGVVWTVAESTAEAAGRYPPVDESFPAPPDGDLDPDRPEVSAEITVVDQRGHWLPRPGWVRSVRIEDGQDDGDTEDGDDVDVRFNAVTGNVALPNRLRAGQRYEVTGVPIPTAVELAGSDLVEGASEFANLQPGIRNFIADVVQGEDPGWPQVTTMVDRLVSEGFYDISDTTRPGHSYFRLGEFLADPERIVGYEEQYAAAAAIAVRTLDRPARVVVGYRIPDDRWEGDTAQVLAADIEAWIEVRTVDGWAAVDVTPDRSRTPEAEEQSRTVEDIAVPNPPPPPPPPPDTDTPEQEDLDEPEVDEQDEEDEPSLASGIPVVVLYVAAGIGSPVVLLAVLALVIGILKARRRRRRRNAPSPALRVAGAWQEVLERCQELGHPRRRIDTNREAAQALAADTATEPALWLQLADHVDRAAFHPSPPSDDDATAAWASADRAAAQLLAGAPLRLRLRLRLDPRPLLRRDLAKL